MAVFDGKLTITNGGGDIPSSSFFLIGEDGAPYTVQGIHGAALLHTKVGSIATLATIWTRTGAEFKTDFDSLALSGVPAANAISTAQGVIPIAGTAYFYVFGEAGSGSNFWQVAVRYKIVSSVSIVIDGGLAYKLVNTSSQRLGTCWDFGATVVDGEAFAICWCYPGSGQPWPGTYLVRLPISAGASIIETDTSVFATKMTYLGTAFNDVLQSPTYFIWGYSNICTILKHPTNATTVMILTYRRTDTLPGSGSALLTPGSEFVLVDWDAQTAGSLTSAQALLGQPWSDAGKNFAGAAGQIYDDYSGPSVTAGAGVNAREVMFSRPYSDDTDLQQTRCYTYDETTGLFTPINTVQWGVTQTAPLTSVAAVIAQRYSPVLVGGARYSPGGSTWLMGEFMTASGVTGRRWMSESGPIRSAGGSGPSGGIDVFGGGIDGFADDSFGPVN